MSMPSSKDNPKEIRSLRKLGLHHIAFFRGHLDGLGLATLGDRYLETGDDVVRAKATLRWIRDELIKAARKARPAYARLLRVPLERIPSPSNTDDDMDLETFRAERDPEGFYTEKELIELFQEAYGSPDPVAARRAAQSDRLRKKLREAVAWLESWAAQEPRRDDPIDAWLDETIAARLIAAGIEALSDLTTTIRKRGKHWHRKVAKLGPVGARRLEKWLKDRHLISSDPVVLTRTSSPALPHETGLVPIERLDLPGVLSGISGTNRAYGTALTAGNDREAVKAWLNSLGPRPHTVRSYRKEAERFLLWCLFERGIAMSSATVEDCTAYRDFLSDLGRKDEIWFWNLPRERWVGQRNVQRWSEDWKPFSGKFDKQGNLVECGLALTSQRLSVTILKILFEWLMRQRYLETNPWDGVSPILSSAPSIRKDHSLTLDQWHLVMNTLDEYEDKDEAYYRLRFTLLLGYMGGFRLDEIANAIVAKHHVKPGEPNPGLKPAEDGDGWDLEVIGKGRKARRVPLATDLMEALTQYMECRGLGSDPDLWPQETPLLVTLPIGMQHAQKRISALSNAALFRMLKKHFAKSARNAPTSRDAGHLLSASTHWLRHTHATHALAAGAAIQDVQENLGHSTPATTAIYSHAGRKRRKAAVERLG